MFVELLLLKKLRREHYEKEPKALLHTEKDPRRKLRVFLKWMNKLKIGRQKTNGSVSDRAMTFTAFEIHKDLVEKEGFDPKSGEYYAEIDKRITC